MSRTRVRNSRDHHHRLLVKPRHLGVVTGLALVALAAFPAWKSWRVAQELVNPPFYHPQTLARVAATYQELARGSEGDPGGSWAREAVGTLELWRLRRPAPSPGLVLLLHGFGDDRWGTSPALKWFPGLEAAIFTYRRRDDALRAGEKALPVTFGATESREVIQIIHHLEATGMPRQRILLMGRSLGASVALLALADLEKEGKGPLAGVIWEGAPASSRSFAERLVRGPQDRWWHILAPAIGGIASRWAGWLGQYEPLDTDLLRRTEGLQFATPSLCFLATEDRLAPPAVQRAVAARFQNSRILEVPTWHLHCSEIMGPAYAAEIRKATRAWLPES